MTELTTKRFPWRPRKYDSPEQMDEAVDSYFQYCTENQKPITYTGLCLFLGFAGRACLDGYLQYEGFAPSVRRAKSLVEMAYEERLVDPTRPAAAAIFGLKNFGWTDRQEIDHRSADGTMTPSRIDTSKLDVEQLAALYAALKPDAQ
jgi:hypothetical protein